MFAPVMRISLNHKTQHPPHPQVMHLQGSRKRKQDFLAIKKGYFGVIMTMSIGANPSPQKDYVGLAIQSGYGDGTCFILLTRPSSEHSLLP